MDKPFTSDHCTIVSEVDQHVCCLEHDWLYWQGGTWRQRAAADRAFRKCIWTTSQQRWRAPIRWLGVRLGGIGIIPTQWRWGYGWKWWRTAAPQPDSSPHSAESQSDTFQALLIEAQRLDEEARRGDR